MKLLLCAIRTASLTEREGYGLLGMRVEEREGEEEEEEAAPRSLQRRTGS